MQTTEPMRQTNRPTSREDRSSQKKPYGAPVLQEWGALAALTHGATTGPQDFPFLGGTEPVF